jgi:hypothetical protein
VPPLPHQFVVQLGAQAGVCSNAVSVKLLANG